MSTLKSINVVHPLGSTANIMQLFAEGTLTIAPAEGA